jgi:hypothetical protein
MLSSSERWHPVQGPVPGPGLTVASPFFLDSGGNYSFEMQIPTPQQSGVNAPEPPPLKANLQVTITGPNNFRVADQVVSLGHSAEYFFGHLSYFQSVRFILPGRGDYVMTVVAADQPQSWASSGAMCGLTLNEDATTAMVGAQLGRVMGIALLALGVAGLIVHGIKTG